MWTGCSAAERLGSSCPWGAHRPTPELVLAQSLNISLKCNTDNTSDLARQPGRTENHSSCRSPNDITVTVLFLTNCFLTQSRPGRLLVWGWRGLPGSAGLPTAPWSSCGPGKACLASDHDALRRVRSSPRLPLGAPTAGQETTGHSTAPECDEA